MVLHSDSRMTLSMGFDSTDTEALERSQVPGVSIPLER